jgi:hypothetical protein
MNGTAIHKRKEPKKTRFPIPFDNSFSRSKGQGEALFITDCVSDPSGRPLAVQMALPFVITFYRDKK